MKRTILIEIDCGEDTCASEPGKFCEYVGHRGLGGTIPICTLFAYGRDVTTDLGEINGGWLRRCDACKNAENPVNG